MAKNLNNIFDYKIKKRLKYSVASVSKLEKYPIQSHKCWERGVYDIVKTEVKKAYYLPQNRRCAYCRKRLNAHAYFNHLDHIIPKSHHKRWMFKPKNLVITCEVCNPLKNADDTLATSHSRTRFPKKRAGFTIFNPHYDRWSDYFTIEEGMFLRGKNSKGDETIKVCKLAQDNIVIQHTEESGIVPKTAIKRALIRQTKFPTGSIEYESAMKVVEYYTQLI